MFASDLRRANSEGWVTWSQFERPSLTLGCVCSPPPPTPKALMDVVTKQSLDTETKLADLQPHPYHPDPPTQTPRGSVSHATGTRSPQ